RVLFRSHHGPAPATIGDPGGRDRGAVVPGGPAAPFRSHHGTQSRFLTVRPRAGDPLVRPSSAVAARRHLCPTEVHFQSGGERSEPALGLAAPNTDAGSQRAGATWGSYTPTKSYQEAAY